METQAKIDELTRPTQHINLYEQGSAKRIHRVTAPALLWQLANVHHGNSSAGEERSSSGYGSSPAARVEAMDVLMLIDREAGFMVRNLGHDDDRDTIGLVKQLGGLLPGLPDPEDRAELEDMVSRWYTMARVATGWDSPRWRPNNTCPMCQTLGTLRIRLADLDAFCVECHATWDRELIGLLAEHLRQENGEQDQVC